MKQKSIIALLYGKDKSGIVADVSNWICGKNGNIWHADQHTDHIENIFFQRVQWISDNNLEEEAQSFKDFARNTLDMNCKIAISSKKQNIAIFVSKFDHCFHDIILRQKSGELNCNISCIISNHEDLKEAAAYYNIPYYYVPVTKQNKDQAEKMQIDIIKKYDCKLIVMARYMQILSDKFLNTAGVNVINIHHSFLPAFAGSKPYHQAYNRGVKLIGATAHYATANLDEGPIIAQDVTTVTHNNTIDDLIRKGRDLEKLVFARAIRCHLENRVLSYKNKTVVFD